MFDARSADDEIDVVEVEFNVSHQSDLEERFAADRQLERVAFDPRAWAELNEDGDAGPPPRAIFTLLSRPNGLRRQGTFFFQGIEFDPGAPNGQAGVTNGILVVSS